MHTIVVLVNFGDNSANAVRYATDIAMVTGAGIRLVHVLQPPATFSPHPMPDFLYKEMRNSGNLLLNRLQAEVSERTGGKVRVDIHLETGDIDHRMEAYCAACKPFLVVMGAARSAPEQAFGAGDAIKAMKQLPYPLLVVPKNAAFHGAPKVVIACDQEDLLSGIPSVIPFSKELRELLGTQIEIVHILTTGESLQDTAQEYERSKKHLEALGFGLHVVRQANVVDGLNDYLEKHPADWLLVLPKNHSLLEFHRSRAKEIVLHCPFPVLSLHE
jgi:nucleotide-binding universal stress UspA family protein